MIFVKMNFLENNQFIPEADQQQKGRGGHLCRGCAVLGASFRGLDLTDLMDSQCDLQDPEPRVGGLCFWFPLWTKDKRSTERLLCVCPVTASRGKAVGPASGGER